MKDNCFIDTNVLVYAHSTQNLQFQASAQNLLKSENLVISTQVLNELINAFRKKFNKDWKSISKIITETTQYYTLCLIDKETVNFAITISAKYGYSYFDSLIIASALESNCKILYSEDLGNTQIIEKTLTIINPFN
jgi:predicted nucleic acid-binding protein